MTERLVIDTNVFIDSYFDLDMSEPDSYLLNNLDNIDVRLVFSRDTIGELMYVMKKICNYTNASEEETKNSLYDVVDLFQTGKSINTKEILLDNERPQCNDPDDQMFVDAALASNAPFIISHDKQSGMFEIQSSSFTCVTPEDYLRYKQAEIEAAGGL